MEASGIYKFPGAVFGEAGAVAVADLAGFLEGGEEVGHAGGVVVELGAEFVEGDRPDVGLGEGLDGGEGGAEVALGDEVGAVEGFAEGFEIAAFEGGHGMRVDGLGC
jgi:hypothetical protein